MAADVGPDAMPQQLDRALVAVRRQHAGAAELEEAELTMALDQAADVELALGVEAAVAVGGVLAEQAVGADYRGLALERAGAVARQFRGVVDDQQVIADIVERI